MTRLLAIAASYRTESLNRQLLAIAATQAQKQGAEVTILDYPSLEAPTYRGEIHVNHLPPTIEKLSAALLAHDGLLLATPEYNWSIPGGLKNLIDWLSIDTREPLKGKHALLICASPSARGGATGLDHLRVCLESLGCRIHPQSIGIARAQDQLKNDALARDTDQTLVQTCVGDFISATKVLSDA